MSTIKIDNKDYKISVTWGKLKKASSKMKSGEENNVGNLITQIWEYLDKGIIFKPFIFKWRLANKITLKELKQADKTIAAEVSMEDREGGNSD